MLVGADQHLVVEEVDELLGLWSAFLPLDAGVNVFRVFAEEDNIHALRILYRRWNALVVLHRTHAGIQVENLAERNVQ